MVATAAAHDASPIAFRYPRGAGTGVDIPQVGKALEVGKGRIVKQGEQVAILSFGARLNTCLQAASELESQGISITVADARFAKPLDGELITKLMKNHKLVLTIEEGSQGGFGSLMLEFLSKNNMLNSTKSEKLAQIKTLCLPDIFQPHGGQEQMYADAGLGADNIISIIKQYHAEMA